MVKDSIRTKCMEFLYDQLSKKAIPQIRAGMLEDLIVLVEGARQDFSVEVMVQRMAQQAGIAEIEKMVTNEQENS